MEDNLPLELDFELEARNTGKCEDMFRGQREYKVPGVVAEVSGKRVLTMEYVEAISIGDSEGLKRADIDSREVARLLAEGFAQQVY